MNSDGDYDGSNNEDEGLQAEILMRNEGVIDGIMC